MGYTDSPHAESWCGRSCPRTPSYLHVTDDLNVFNFILTREGSSDSIELNTFNLRAWKPEGRSARPRLLRPTG